MLSLTLRVMIAMIYAGDVVSIILGLYIGYLIWGGRRKNV